MGVLSDLLNTRLVDENEILDDIFQKSEVDNLTSLLFKDITSDCAYDCYNLLRTYGTRKVCQYKFRKNDIVWICKDCQRDETCVFCNECFLNSNHDGHDVYFYHSNAGGCCDCGDAEALNIQGFCSIHGKSPSILNTISTQNTSHTTSATTATATATTADTTIGTRVVVEEDNFITSFPPLLITSARELFSEIVTIFDSYCHSISHLGNKQNNITLQGEIQSIKIRIIGDDIHKKDDYERILSVVLGQHTVSSETLNDLMNNLYTKGYFHIVLLQGANSTNVATYAAAILLALRDQHQLTAYFIDDSLIQQEYWIYLFLIWCHKLAQLNDGMSQLISEAFIEQHHLITILKSSCHLSKLITMKLHDLIISLVSYYPFKRYMASAYAESFTNFSHDYIQGIGLAEYSIFTLAVQFLNRQVLVNEMIMNKGFLHILIDMLAKCITDIANEHKHNRILTVAAKYKRYTPIIGDLKIMLIHPEVSRYLFSMCFPTWLNMLSSYELIHTQTRQLSTHIEYTNDDWFWIFNVSISLANTYPLLFNWINGLSTSITTTYITNINKSMWDEYVTLYETLPDDFTLDLSCTNNTIDTKRIDIDNTDTDMVTRRSPYELFNLERVSYMNNHVKSTDKCIYLINIPIFFFTVYKKLKSFYTQFIENTSESRMKLSLHIPITTMTTTSTCSTNPKNNMTMSTSTSTSIQSSNTDIYTYYIIPFPPYAHSFHIQLHRFMAMFLVELLKHPSLQEIVIYIFDYLSHHPQTMIFMMEFPLRTIIFAAEIRRRLWVRNGSNLKQELYNYNESSFCRIFSDLDLFLIQLGVLQHPNIDYMMSLLLYRFHILDTFTQQKHIDDTTTNSPYTDMIEEFLILVIHMMTELPPAADSDIFQRLQYSIRRELIHKLAAGPMTYSQLCECIPLLGDTTTISSKDIESIIQSISSIRTLQTVQLETPKRHINLDCWLEYDPCYYHLSPSSHQAISELRPKISTPQPIVCKPSAGHIQMQPLRTCFLQSHSVLFPVLRLLTLSYIRVRMPTSEKYISLPIENADAMGSINVYTRVIHILTLCIYQLKEISQIYQNDVKTGNINIDSDKMIVENNDDIDPKIGADNTLEILSMEKINRIRSSFIDFLISDQYNLYPMTSFNTEASTSCTCIYDGPDTTNSDKNDIHNTSSSSRSSSEVPTPSSNNGNRPSIFKKVINRLLSSSPPPPTTTSTSTLSKQMTNSPDNHEEKKEDADISKISYETLHIYTYTSNNHTIESQKPVIQPSFLSALLDILTILKQDHMEINLYYWTKWVINEIQVLDTRCDDVITGYFTQQENEEHKLKIEQRKKRARQKAMKNMKTSVDSFAAFMDESTTNNTNTDTKSSPEKSGDQMKITSSSSSPMKSRTSSDLNLQETNKDNKEDIKNESIDNKATTEISMKQLQDENEMELSCVICHTGEEESSDYRFNILCHMAYVQASNMVYHSTIYPHLYDGSTSSSSSSMDLSNTIHQHPELRTNQLPTHIHINECKHVIHMKCYYTHIHNQLLHATQHRNDLQNPTRNQFLCPLCKSLCNIIIPHIHSHEGSLMDIHIKEQLSTFISMNIKLEHYMQWIKKPQLIFKPDLCSLTNLSDRKYKISLPNNITLSTESTRNTSQKTTIIPSNLHMSESVSEIDNATDKHGHKNDIDESNDLYISYTAATTTTTSTTTTTTTTTNESENTTGTNNNINNDNNSEQEDIETNESNLNSNNQIVSPDMSIFHQEKCQMILEFISNLLHTYKTDDEVHMGIQNINPYQFLYIRDNLPLLFSLLFSYVTVPNNTVTDSGLPTTTQDLSFLFVEMICPDTWLKTHSYCSLLSLFDPISEPYIHIKKSLSAESYLQIFSMLNYEKPDVFILLQVLSMIAYTSYTDILAINLQNNMMNTSVKTMSTTCNNTDVITTNLSKSNTKLLVMIMKIIAYHFIYTDVIDDLHTQLCITFSSLFDPTLLPNTKSTDSSSNYSISSPISDIYYQRDILSWPLYEYAIYQIIMSFTISLTSTFRSHYTADSNEEVTYDIKQLNFAYDSISNKHLLISLNWTYILLLVQLIMSEVIDMAENFDIPSHRNVLSVDSGNNMIVDTDTTSETQASSSNENNITTTSTNNTYIDTKSTNDNKASFSSSSSDNNKSNNDDDNDDDGDDESIKYPMGKMTIHSFHDLLHYLTYLVTVEIIPLYPMHTDRFLFNNDDISTYGKTDSSINTTTTNIQSSCLYKSVSIYRMKRILNKWLLFMQSLYSILVECGFFNGSELSNITPVDIEMIAELYPFTSEYIELYPWLNVLGLHLWFNSTNAATTSSSTRTTTSNSNGSSTNNINESVDVHVASDDYRMLLQRIIHNAISTHRQHITHNKSIDKQLNKVLLIDKTNKLSPTTTTTDMIFAVMEYMRKYSTNPQFLQEYPAIFMKNYERTVSNELFYLSSIIKPPELLSLPPSYTQFHAMVTTLSTHDHPAVCLVCGIILNSAGKGECCAHVLKCSGDSGIFFLLQEHKIILIHGNRCLYYQSPYVDEYGECHHHYRGKPLHLDTTRYFALQQLWREHKIPKEIIHKRIISPYVINLGYY